MLDLLITNGLLVSPSVTIQADVAVKDGKVAGIFEPGTPVDTKQVLDARGLYVVPGGVDPHAHFGMEFGGSHTRDDLGSGAIAAAFGGTTTVIDFAFQEPGSSAMEILRRRQSWAQDCGPVIDYSFHSGLTDGSHRTITEMEEIVQSGIASFKLFTVYREEGLYVDDAALFTIFQKAARLGVLPVVHAENEQLVTWATQQLLRQGKVAPRYYPASRPRVAELEAARRAILLAREAGSALYLVHVTSQEVAEEVGLERRRGYPIYGETCPHYLTLTGAVYEGETGFNYIMSPPLRRKEDNEALWKAVAKGDLSTIASDESSWHVTDKSKGRESFDQAPPGLVGVETRLPLVFSEGVQKGRFSIDRFVELVATNPAKLFGLFPQKGIIAIGSDADIVLIDPEKKGTLDHQNLHHGAGYSPYQGWEVKGLPVTTMCRGTIIVDNGELVAPRRHGRFLKRNIDRAYLASPVVS